MQELNKQDFFDCDKYSRATTIQGRKLLISRTFLVRQVFKGDNYSREETIRGNTVVVFIKIQLYVPMKDVSSYEYGDGSNSLKKVLS